MFRKAVLLVGVLLLFATVAFPQAQSYGRIEGAVTDAQGLVLPGVNVTLSGEELMGTRVATTDVDGSYRFPALGPGSYNLLFELPGFGSLNRQGVVVQTGSTFTVNAQLELATVAETVTVTGESPVVDVKTTGVSVTFDRQQLDEVPSATDMWAVLQQTPGVRMSGYDVGGSHKSQQSGYSAFGINSQVRIVNEGVNTTEGTGGAGGYYDYYAVEEFQVSAQGADVEMSTPGAQVVATWKSGGNSFSSLTHFDFETAGMVTDNIDSGLEARAGTSAPVREFKEFHVDVGGPVVRDKFWFYGAYNYFKIDRIISGQDPDVATDIGLFDEITAKINWQITDRDQFIGFSHWSLKQKPARGLSLTIPFESIRAQDSWTWLHKAEWQRVASDRLFFSVMLGHFGFGWPMVPQVDPATNPARIDLATSQQRGAGWQPFTWYRYKPQSTGQVSYYVPSAGGSHDFKFGWDWQIDSSQFGWNTNSGALRYRDDSNLGPSNGAQGQLGATNEIDFFNVPTMNDDRNMHTDFYAQDVWQVNNRLTLTLGVRFGRQRVYYLDSTQTPVLGEFFDPVEVTGQDVITMNNIAPRLGATIDVTGEGRSVFKAYYGRYYSNLGSGISPANPGAQTQFRYEFLDPNNNGLYDGQGELGALVNCFGNCGGAGEGTPVDQDTKQAYVDEFSFSFEHELMADTSVRLSYVRKQTRNPFATSALTTFNNAQTTEKLTQPYTATCDGCPGSFDGSTLNLRTLPDGAPSSDILISNPPGDNNSKYDNIEFALSRRFRNNWFFQGGFGYNWSSARTRPSSVTTSPLNTDPLDNWFLPEFNTEISHIQDTTGWGLNAAARYVAPYEIGIAGTYRHQSGFMWAPIYNVTLPVVGSKPVFLENINNNRSDNVNIVDLRVDKSFTFGDRYTVTGMFDVYNVLNSNPETNFILTSGASFNNIIEWLQGRTLKLGVRFQF